MFAQTCKVKLVYDTVSVIIIDVLARRSSL